MGDTGKKFNSIALLAHHKLKAAAVEAASIAEYLHNTGAKTAVGFLNDESLRRRVQAGEFDLVITLGGDGTVLRAGHLCAPHDIPILAINHGRFGFLIEVTSGEWKAYIDNMLAGKYWFEKRMMLQCDLNRKGETVGRWDVLNEVVIGRGQMARPVQLSAQLDGNPLTTYVADALIVSTPTGSTAYALAAGGPILPPELRNILLIPVAPHISMDRAIVLAEGASVVVEALSTPAIISVDGQTPEKLRKGDKVLVYLSEYNVRFVRFQQAGYFYSRIISLMDQHPSAGEVKT
jgi:NAD+ kinase